MSNALLYYSTMATALGNRKFSASLLWSHHLSLTKILLGTYLSSIITHLSIYLSNKYKEDTSEHKHAKIDWLHGENQMKNLFSFWKLHLHIYLHCHCYFFTAEQMWPSLSRSGSWIPSLPDFLGLLLLWSSLLFLVPSNFCCHPLAICTQIYSLFCSLKKNSFFLDSGSPFELLPSLFLLKDNVRQNFLKKLSIFYFVPFSWLFLSLSLRY